MTKLLIPLMMAIILPMFPTTLHAQEDVTRFLGIPVDGTKSEMIRKLKEKGFTSSISNKDVLEGEFNGTNVRIHIVTNNNKVYRIMVADVNRSNETNIKIRFNRLCQQFHHNKKYISLSDSSVSKYVLPEDEDISYGLTVKKKRYQAVFYQKPLDYDSLNLEMKTLLTKEPFTDVDKERLSTLLARNFNIYFDKEVWFMINEIHGEYYILMYYDNNYNKANGEDL